MHVLRTTFVIISLTLILVTQTGCLAIAAAGAAGAGVAYAKGDSSNTVEGTPPQVAMAAEHAFLQMGMVVVSNRSSMVDCEVIARTAQDEKVDVVAKAQTDRFSEVSVRVGTFGDDSLQSQVLMKIRENLVVAAQPPATSEANAEN
jgi:hypothetical protein